MTRKDNVKRSFQAVLALLVVVAGFGLVTAPSGAVVAPKAKVFTVSSAPTSSVWSQSVKLTVTLTPKGGGQPRGGTVTFLSDGLPLGTATATTRNTTLTTRELPPGDHTITASYSGDPVIAAGTTTNSATASVAAAPTTITLRATQDPVPYEEKAEIKATVLAASPALPQRRPTGSVTFSVDGCLTATVKLNSNGVATWRPWLCPGERTITATYEGSERHAPSDLSAPLVITILDPDGGIPGEDDENLDQVNSGDPADFLIIYDDSEMSSAFAQTIATGRTGRIYAVDLVGTWVSDGDTAPEDLQIGIYTLDEDGEPTGAPLGTGTLAAADVERNVTDIFHVELDTVADVEVGVSYAIVLSVEAQTPDAYGLWLIAGTAEDTYAAGELLEDVDHAGWTAYEPLDTDLLFRTHLGDPV